MPRAQWSSIDRLRRRIYRFEKSRTGAISTPSEAALEAIRSSHFPPPIRPTAASGASRKKQISSSNSLLVGSIHSVNVRSMKFHWLYLLLALVAGLLAGRLAPGRAPMAQENASEDGYSNHRTKSGERVSEAPDASAVGRLRREIRQAPASQLSGLVYRSLEVTDPVERRLLLMEALRLADGPTCMAIVQQFKDLTAETGRDPNIEWEMVLFETGKKAGSEALEAWKAEGKGGGNPMMWHALYGMASKDPAAAMAWLNSPTNGDLPNHDRLISAVLAGAALGKSDQSTRFLAELPEELRKSCIGHYAWNIVQSGGIDGGIDWMLETKKQYADSDPGYAAAVEREMLERIYKSNVFGGAGSKMADHLARIYQSAPMNPEQLISLASRLPGSDRLDLISNLSSKNVFQDNNAEEVLHRIVSQTSPQEANAWLAAHPHSPIRGAVELQLNGTSEGN